MNDITQFSDDKKEVLCITTFDLTGMDSNEIVGFVKDHEELNEIENQRTYLIGERLSRQKKRLKHLQGSQGWMVYIEKFTPYYHRQAESFIAEFENPDFFNMLKKFSRTDTSLLLKAPEPVREEILQRHDEGEKITRQKILEATKEYKNRITQLEKEKQETKNLLEQLMDEKESLLEQNAELNKAPKVIEKEVIKEVIPEDYETLKQKESLLRNAELEAHRKIEMAKDKASEILTPIEDRVNDLKDQENFLSGRVNQLTNDLALFTTEERDREVRRKETDNLYKEIKSYLAIIGDTKVSEIVLSEKQRIVELLEVTNILSKIVSQWVGHSGNYIEGELV